MCSRPGVVEGEGPKLCRNCSRLEIWARPVVFFLWKTAGGRQPMTVITQRYSVA